MKETDQVFVRVFHQKSGVRIYGNKSFFALLQTEISRILAGPDDGQCEFQLISLASDCEGLEQRPDYQVYNLECEASDFSGAVKRSPEEYDMIFMGVIPRDFQDIEECK